MNDELLKLLQLVKDEKISIDEAAELLEAMYKPIETKNSPTGLPWSDDNKLRIAAFKGHKHIKNETACRDYKFNVEYAGDTLNVECCGNLQCENVEGNVSAGGGVNCDDIGGNLNCGGGVNCGDVGGDVNCGGGAKCGDIGGDVNSGGGANCGDVEGNVSCGGGAKCGDIGGDLIAKGADVTCGDVSGNVEAQNVRCKSAGNISYDNGNGQ